jgi:predicted site-specific integrase-resolvase
VSSHVTRFKTKMLTPSEFAARYGVQRARVYQWIARGQIHVEAYGAEAGEHPRYLIDPSEINRVAHLLTRSRIRALSS